MISLNNGIEDSELMMFENVVAPIKYLLYLYFFALEETQETALQEVKTIHGKDLLSDMSLDVFLSTLHSIPSRLLRTNYPARDKLRPGDMRFGSARSPQLPCP